MKKIFLLFLLAFSLFSPFAENTTNGGVFPVAFAGDPPKCDAGDKTCKIELLEKLPSMESSTIDIKGMNSVQILGLYISHVFKFGLALVSIFSVIMVMIGGYEYMTAGGESSKADNAKTRIEQALFGLILVFLSALLLNFINPNFFKLS